MASSAITDDYYMVLDVGQTVTPELVIRSYKRLALKLHPDRNANHDATEAFQLLGRAYETLKDESKRRAYDLIYPSITRSRPFPQTTLTSRPPPASTPPSGALSEAAQIATFQKSKQERGARWSTKKSAFDCSIFELQMKACPRCQGALRLRILDNAARTNRRAPPRARTPSPGFFYD